MQIVHFCFAKQANVFETSENNFGYQFLPRKPELVNCDSVKTSGSKTRLRFLCVFINCFFFFFIISFRFLKLRELKKHIWKHLFQGFYFALETLLYEKKSMVLKKICVIWGENCPMILRLTLLSSQGHSLHSFASGLDGQCYLLQVYVVS